MLLIINGQKQEHADGITLGALLETLRLPLSGVVVERNREIVPRAALRDLALTGGDSLEIVRLVGGG